MARRARRRLLVSCEHGGNRVPEEYAPLFAGAADVLATHRGLDIGALEVARAFGRRLGVTPFTATTTRLVVDLNRSPGNRDVFSAYTRGLTASNALRRSRRTTGRIATPSKARSRTRSRRRSRAARVGAQLHAGVARRSPQLRRRLSLRSRARRGEVRFIEAWYAALRAAAPELTLRRNYPYSGVSDALVTHLRRRYGSRGYLGMELEVNQKHVGGRGWRALVAVLGATLATAVEHG